MQAILNRDLTLKIDGEESGYVVKKLEEWDDTKKTYKRLYSVKNLKGDIVMDDINLKEFRKEYKNIKNRSRKDEILQLSKNPTAIMLCEYLRANHNGINRYFNIFQEPVAKELNTSANTLRKAIEFLLKKKILSRHKISNKKCKLTQREKGFTYEYRFL